MQAVQAGPFGIEHLRVADLPDPAPAPGEVLIATEAATINPADLGIVTGSAAPRFPAGATAPFTPERSVRERKVCCAPGQGVIGVAS